MPGPDERRAEWRVGQTLPVGFNLLPSPRSYVRLESATPSSPPPDNGPKPEGRDELERFLLQLDQKLDRILAILTSRMQKKEYRHRGRAMDISESGLGLMSTLELPVGTTLEIGLALPTEPHRSIDVAGEVVWSRPDPAGEWSAGIKFNDILTLDQDAIVHWQFQRQREELRRKKADPPA